MWDDGTFWAGAREGRLPLRACRHCAEICHPPLPMCPHCQSLEWDMADASGRALLKSWFASVHPGKSDDADRIVAVVQLEEGVSFVSNVTGTALNALHRDMPLELYFAEVGDVTIPQFRPVDRL